MDFTQKKILSIDDNPGNLTVINGIRKKFLKFILSTQVQPR